MWQGSLKLSALLLVLVRNFRQMSLVVNYVQDKLPGHRQMVNTGRKELNRYRGPGFRTWFNSAPHQAFPNVLITRASDSMRTTDL